MIAAALSLSLFTALMPHHEAPRAPSVVRARLDSWTYEVRTDSFTGEKACRLFGRDPRSHVRMIYVPGAVAFQLPASQDTRAAVYRIDNGAPHATRDDETALIQQHVVMPDPMLNQGALGLVFIPQQAVAGARQVAIRTSPEVPPRTVELGGLDRALAAAEAQGCAPGAFAQLDLPE